MEFILILIFDFTEIIVFIFTFAIV